MELFELGPVEGSPTRIPTNWDYIRRNTEVNIEYVKNYYKINPTAVRSEHILVRLLNSLGIPLILPMDRYVNHLSSKAVRVASSLGISSGYSKGGCFYNQFYGENKVEILLAHESIFNYEQTYLNWKTQVPIEVLRHPETSLDFPILDGKRNEGTGGVCVIAINVVMLGLMYKAFVDEEVKKENKDNPKHKSVMEFIRMYVLPGMIGSHLDISVFNRLNNLRIGIPNDMSIKRTHSFHMPIKLSDKIETCQRDILKNIEQGGYTYSKLLSNIPLLATINAIALNQVPETPQNRQIYWAVLLSRIYLIDFLINVNKASLKSNTSYINKIKRTIKMLMANNEHETILPFYYNLEFKKMLEGILEV